MIVKTSEFTSMKGHVADGCVIIAPNGKRFTLKNTIKGWRVRDDKGHERSGNLPTYLDVEMFVIHGLGAGQR